MRVTEELDAMQVMGIPRGFYQDGVWSDSGFMRWSTISGVSWKEEPQHVTLILVSNTRNVARRLAIGRHSWYARAALRRARSQ